MSDDGGLRKYLDEETVRALHRQRWFVRQRRSVRFVVTLGLASVLTGLSALLYLALTTYRGFSASQPTFWVPLAMVGIIFYGMAIAAALNPTRYLRHNLEFMARYPTRAPGYGTWRGDDDRPRPANSAHKDESRASE